MGNPEISETEALATFWRKRHESPPILHTGSYELTMHNQTIQANWTVLRPQTVNTVVYEPWVRFVPLDENTLLPFAQFLEHPTAVYGVLGAVHTENSLVALDFYFAGVNDHEYVLGAMLEAKLNKKSILNATTHNLRFPIAEADIRFDCRITHHTGVLDVDVFVKQVPNDENKKQQVIQVSKTIATAARFTTFAVSRSVLEHTDWPYDIIYKPSLIDVDHSCPIIDESFEA